MINTRHWCSCALIVMAFCINSMAQSSQVRPISYFQEADPVFRTDIVPPGSWIVITSSVAQKRSSRQALSTDNYCGLKSGLVVEFDSWSFDKKESQTVVNRLKLDKKSAYMKNVGAWSNVKPCVDSSNLNSWRFRWKGGELSGEFAKTNTLYVNGKSFTKIFDGSNIGAIKIYQDSNDVLFLQLEDDVDIEEGSSLSNQKILGFDGHGKEMLRMSYAVGDDYSDHHCELMKTPNGRLCLLKGNPTKKRVAMQYDPQSGTFKKIMDVSNQ